MNQGESISANDKMVSVPKSQLLALIGSFIVAFIGSWVQLNQRMSKMETQIEHLETVVKNVGTIQRDVAIIVERTENMQRQLKDQSDELKEVRTFQGQK